MTTTESTPKIPIACNPQVFAKEDLAAHVALSMDVIFRWPKTIQELPEGFVFEYRGNEEVFFKVARFAYNEHRCCPWVSFALEMEPFAAGSEGVIRLRYIAGVEGKPFLAEAIKKLAAAAQDPEAQARLLATVGTFSSITPDNKDSFYERASGNAPGLLSKVKAACGC